MASTRDKTLKLWGIKIATNMDITIHRTMPPRKAFAYAYNGTMFMALKMAYNAILSNAGSPVKVVVWNMPYKKGLGLSDSYIHTYMFKDPLHPENPYPVKLHVGPYFCFMEFPLPAGLECYGVHKGMFMMYANLCKRRRFDEDRDMWKTESLLLLDDFIEDRNFLREIKPVGIVSPAEAPGPVRTGLPSFIENAATWTTARWKFYRSKMVDYRALWPVDAFNVKMEVD